MRISVKYAIWLLPLMPLVQGCSHKAQTSQTTPLAPPIVDKPLPKPSSVSTADLPPPVLGDTTPAKNNIPKPDVSSSEPAPEKKPAKHVRKTAPVATAQVPATAPAGQQEGTSTPSSVSAIGQLSGGGSSDVKSQTEETINTTEKGLNSITRPLSDSETHTAAQIREFLKQAREALTTGDTDGAHTLAVKAKVLLTELNPK